MKQLVTGYNLHIKTEIPESLFRQYLDEEIHFWHQPVDTGCWHSNSLEIDAGKTFLEFKKFQNGSFLGSEINWLRKNHIDLVLSDVASMPIKAAYSLGIPSVLIGNFTWHDIYSHLSGAAKQKGLLQNLEEEYSCADLQILPQCHLIPSLAKESREVGFLAEKGRDIRHALEEYLDISFTGKTLVFIYLGEQGTHSVLWGNLPQNRDCLFITRDSIGQTVPGLYKLNDRFRFPDLITSADVVCTKGGYSTLASAFASNKPVISCERRDFHEFKAIREYLHRTRTGVIIEDDDFYKANWQTAIKTALGLTVKDKVPLNGEVEILETVRQILS